MDVTGCILGKVASGSIDKDFAEQNLKKLQQYEKQLEFYPELTKEKALLDFANQLQHLADVKKLQLVKDVEVQRNLRRQIAAHPKGKAAGLMSTLTHDLSGRADGLNVDKLRESIKGLSYGQMPDAVLKLHLNYLGMSFDKKARKLAQDMVRAVFGETGNEEAEKIAVQFKTVMADLRRRFNASGGDIPELDNYHLPQNHDSRLLNEVSAEEWINFVDPLLDARKMIDNETGWPMANAKRREVLAESYETLRTNGLNKIEPGSPRRTKLANKYNEQSRVLHFKDADSWIAYNERFGNGDIYKTMVDYVDGMADDIAFLEIYGSNPEHTKNLLIDEIRKEAGTGRNEKLREKTNSEIEKFNVLWDDISGNAAVPINARVAKVNSEIRALMTSAQLGGAFLSQASDLVTNSLTAKLNGLSQGELFKNYLRLMSSNKYRDFSIHLGLGADELTRVLNTTNRMSEGILSNGKMAKVSGLVMRASLLERMTMASKKAFELDYSYTLGKLKNVEFGKLPKEMRGTFEKYGLSPEDWNIVRSSRMDALDGAEYVNMIALSKENLEVANKLQNLILTERDFAVIDSNPRTRAVLIGNSRPGTAWGEAKRYFAMYKTFPLTILMHHMSRLISLEGAGTKLGYAAALFAPMTLMGYLSVQAKNLVAGKKPLPADNWKTWLASAAQGGGAGIIGDFLFSEESRTGNDIVSTLAGPGGSLLNDIWKVTGGAAKRAIAGDDVNYPSELINFFKRYTPGNNLWQTKLVTERLLVDQLSLLADPKARKRFRRQERQLRKEYDTEYWWRPGETTPDF